MLRKREEELVLKKMSATDTPLQTMEKLKEKQKSTGSAFVVLANKSKESQQQERCVLGCLRSVQGWLCLRFVMSLSILLMSFTSIVSA